MIILNLNTREDSLRGFYGKGEGRPLVAYEQMFTDTAE
jgi:hypothetical protein